MFPLVKQLNYLIILFFLTSCAPTKLANFKPPETIIIPSGAFISGSNRQERDYAYDLDQQAYGHDRTRKAKWYENEFPRHEEVTETYEITKTPITNAQYASFVTATNHPAPFVSEKEWRSYGLIHPYDRVKKYLWKNGTYPLGMENHPVVLVSYEDATAYANWLSFQTGEDWRLPSEVQWEKATRGTDGRIFPWGDAFEPSHLNSHDQGPFSTTEISNFPSGNSPYGLSDAAGQVFEWTGTKHRNDRHIVKGGSWDDKGCGVCRPSARHGRPSNLKHILIGFRVITIE